MEAKRKAAGAQGWMGAHLKSKRPQLLQPAHLVLCSLAQIADCAWGTSLEQVSQTMVRRRKMLLLHYAVAVAQEFPAVGPFRLVQERREWADAEARCVSIGGHLAS